MKCADEWEKDPVNAQAIAESDAEWERLTPQERRGRIDAFMGLRDPKEPR